MKLLAAMLALTLFGCSEAHTSDVVGARSGTRLRAWVDDGGGGARRFVGWHDTELDVDCQFVSRASGDQVCIPTPLGAALYFTDAACTEAVVFIGPLATSSPHYVATYTTTADTCSTGAVSLGSLASVTVSAVHEIGREVAAPAHLFVLGASCSPVMLGTGTASFAEVGDEVPLDRFVSATETMTAHAGGVTSRDLTASDGSLGLAGLFDTSRGNPCYRLTTDAPRCVAANAQALQTAYTDASCTLRAGLVGSTSCPAPSYAIIAPDDCDALELHALGAPASTLYDRSSGTCAATTPGSSNAFTLGPALEGTDADAFAPRFVRTVVGTGSLRLATYGVDAASVSGEWITSDGVACDELSLGGQVVCVPDPILGSNTFQDAACTQMLIASVAGECAPSTQVALDPSQVLHAIGDAYTGRVFVQPSDGACTETMRTTAVTYRSLGAAIDPATLPHITRALD